MAEIGDTLCRALFLSNRDATRLWDRAREDLASTRVEIVTDVRHAASVPWELIRDPETRTPLALEAESFVRATRMPAKQARGAPDTVGRPHPHPPRHLPPPRRRGRPLPVRRRPAPQGPGRGLARDRRSGGPAAAHLRGAREDAARREDVRQALPRRPLRRPRRVPGRRGREEAARPPLGRAARTSSTRGAGESTATSSSRPPTRPRRRAGSWSAAPRSAGSSSRPACPVLVLNACRSAHADPPPEPEKKEEGAKDMHGDVASFGSLALEVMDKGVSGVVAMRYNVYVVTAAQFVADLYGALADGLSLGEAVSLGRKQLAAKPQREIGFDPVPLQDWCVPVVYEAERLPLFPEPPSKRIVKLEVGAGRPGRHGGAGRGAGGAGRGVLRAGRDAAGAGPGVRQAPDRAAPRLRGEREDEHGGGVRAVVREDRRGGGAGAVDELRAADDAGAGARRGGEGVRAGCSSRTGSSGWRCRTGSGGGWRCRSWGRCPSCGCGTTSSRWRGSRRGRRRRGRRRSRRIWWGSCGRRGGERRSSC